MSLNIITAVLLLGIFYLDASANGELRITSFGPEGSNERFECREHFVNGSVVTHSDPDLFLFNATRQRVTSLLDDRGAFNDFDPVTGTLTFEVTQDIEGYYFCSRDSSPDSGLPEARLYRTVVGKHCCDKYYYHRY